MKFHPKSILCAFYGLAYVNDDEEKDLLKSRWPHNTQKMSNNKKKYKNPFKLHLFLLLGSWSCRCINYIFHHCSHSFRAHDLKLRRNFSCSPKWLHQVQKNFKICFSPLLLHLTCYLLDCIFDDGKFFQSFHLFINSVNLLIHSFMLKSDEAFSSSEGHWWDDFVASDGNNVNIFFFRPSFSELSQTFPYMYSC